MRGWMISIMMRVRDRDRQINEILVDPKCHGEVETERE